MTYCIIRTYEKQQHIAIKCYESMKALSVADSYIFWADEGDFITRYRGINVISVLGLKLTKMVYADASNLYI